MSDASCPWQRSQQKHTFYINKRSKWIGVREFSVLSLNFFVELSLKQLCFSIHQNGVGIESNRLLFGGCNVDELYEIDPSTAIQRTATSTTEIVDYLHFCSMKAFDIA